VPPTEPEKSSEWDAGLLQLPDELYARMATAAELHSTTVLKSCLVELRQLGPGAEQLAEHIRHLMRSYDMDGILRLISRAAVPAASAAKREQPCPQASRTHELADKAVRAPVLERSEHHGNYSA